MTRVEWLSKLHSALEGIAKECKAILMAVLDSDKGINDKVGRNTLSDSNLYRELGVGVVDFEVVNLIVNGYIQYIESGRAPGSWPPPKAIAEWCQRKGIPSDNATVYLISRSIYQKGISPRPIFEGEGGVWAMIDAEFEDFADVIFQTITEYLDNIEI